MSKHDFVQADWTQQDGKKVKLSRCAVCGIMRKESMNLDGSGRRAYYQRVGTDSWITTPLLCGDTRLPKSKEDRKDMGIPVRESYKTDVKALTDFQPGGDMPWQQKAAMPVTERIRREEPVQHPSGRVQPMTPLEAQLTESFVVLKTIVSSLAEAGLLPRLPGNEQQLLANYFESKGYKDWYAYLKQF